MELNNDHTHFLLFSPIARQRPTSYVFWESGREPVVLEGRDAAETLQPLLIQIVIRIVRSKCVSLRDR